MINERSKSVASMGQKNVFFWLRKIDFFENPKRTKSWVDPSTSTCLGRKKTSSSFGPHVKGDLLKLAEIINLNHALIVKDHNGLITS